MAKGEGKGAGRPVTNKTKLGRMINQREVKIYMLSGATEISPRLLTEYVQARRLMTREHIRRICAYLNCKAVDIIEPGLTTNLTKHSGVVIENPKASVRTLDMSHLEPHTNVAPQRIIRKVS